MKKEEVITHFNTLVNQQRLEIKDWIINTDRLLTDNGCKISSNGKGVFTYTSRKTNLRVCIIQMGDEGTLDNAEKREIIEKWLLMELACS